MLKQNKFGHGLKAKPICLRLIAVYDTETSGPYSNYLLPDPEIMGCAIYTRAGNGSLILKDGTKLELYPDSVVFARHIDVSRLHSEGGTWHFHCYWFDFTEAKIPFRTVTPYWDDESRDDSFVTTIIGLLSKGTDSDGQEADALFTSKLFHFLNQTHVGSELIGKNAKIQPIIDYLRDNAYQNETISSIAKKVGYCEKQLRNLFKEYVGISPKQYILRLKIDKSCELLESSAFSISQISETFSFSSPYHYTNAFKKIKGVSPTAYRKKAMKNASSL